MISLFIFCLTIISYSLATVLLWQGVRSPAQSSKFSTLALSAATAGIISHAVLLYRTLLTPSGLDIGLANAASLIAWQTAAVLVVCAWRLPITNLGLPILPVVAVAAMIGFAYPNTGYHLTTSTWQLETHIILSVLAFSLIVLSVVLALSLNWQDRQLRRHQPTRLMQNLPPLQTMEELLFQTLFMGFLLLNLALLTGFMFINDLFAQHLAHKTLLSIAAWLIFATLLWGRWRYGWRGRVATRWTLSGAAALTLAYFGSKLVLEVMLGRQWG